VIRTQAVSLKSRTGLTLVELILVIAIVAILAALILPKLDGLQSNAGHAVGASSAVDLYGMLEVYKLTKHAYPDNWDSLMDSSGAKLWTASAPSGGTNDAPVLGLDPELLATPPVLTTATLVQSDVTALNSAGINTLLNLDAATTATRPGDMFTATSPVAVGSTVAVVSPLSTAGAKIIDHIYPANKLNGGANSGIIPTGSKLVAFGFGPQNAMVGKMVSECPAYPNVDPAVTYNRLLVIIEVTATKATVRTVCGADGDLISDMIANTSKTPS
jgi:prepilin-type N-terminal cleavage/methylation domain-containing protein